MVPVHQRAAVTMAMMRQALMCKPPWTLTDLLSS